MLQRLLPVKGSKYGGSAMIVLATWCIFGRENDGADLFITSSDSTIIVRRQNDCI